MGTEQHGVNRLSVVAQRLQRLVTLGLLLACYGIWDATAQQAELSSNFKLPPMQAPLNPEYYPTTALKKELQGRVLAEFTITRKGKVDNITIVDSEPQGVFDSGVRKALADVRFTVPDDWESSGGVLQRFHLSYVFTLYPCPTNPCVAPKPHTAADDFFIISVQAAK